LPRRRLEVRCSPNTVFVGGSTRRGGDEIEDDDNDAVPDVGVEKASAFLLSKQDNARSSTIRGIKTLGGSWLVSNQVLKRNYQTEGQQRSIRYCRLSNEGRGIGTT
jgi:hypothetical protein